jgi:beta-xylosidase
MTFNPKIVGEEAGLIVFGSDYARLSMKNIGGKLILRYSTCKEVVKKNVEEVCKDSLVAENQTIYLKVKVAYPGNCSFYYSFSGKDFKQIGIAFEAKKGVWIGSKVGLFCTRPIFKNDGGYAVFDWFRIEKD